MMRNSENGHLKKWVVHLTKMNEWWIRREIENLMKIKSAEHASQSSDWRYSYAYTWNIEYWWSRGTYMHESMLLLLKFQANKCWIWEIDDVAGFDDLNGFNVLSELELASTD
jgi:hypothetical protein